MNRFKKRSVGGSSSRRFGGRPVTSTGARRSRAAGVLFCLLAVSFLFSSTASAAEVWEYSPYQVRVWLAMQPDPALTDRLRQRIAQTVQWQAEISDLAAWQVEVKPAPQYLRMRMIDDLAGITIPPDIDPKESIVRGDRILLVSVAVTAGGYRIQARSLDCQYRAWGPVVERTTWQLSDVPTQVYAALKEAFVPMVRIEKVFKLVATVRVRAGGLARNEFSPAWISDDAVLQPWIRKTDRKGVIKKGGLDPVQWTLLTVASRDKTQLQCDIHSGRRAALGGRASGRVEKVAFVERPTQRSTMLYIESEDKEPHPLAGYQIYSRLPGVEESELLGVTDWRGSLRIDPAETSPIRTLYVKSGNRLLRRLPMIPGAFPELRSPMPDDDFRLEAERIIATFENDFMDTVARRQVAASEAREAIKEKEFRVALEQINKLRKLASRGELLTRLGDEQIRLKAPTDNMQRRVDRLFHDLENLINSHLDPQLASQLNREFKAKGGDKAAKAAAGE